MIANKPNAESKVKNLNDRRLRTPSNVCQTLSFQGPTNFLEAAPHMIWQARRGMVSLRSLPQDITLDIFTGTCEKT